MTTYAEAPSTVPPTRTLPAASASVSASAALLAGVLQIVHEPSGPDSVVGVTEHVLIGMLSLFLVAQLPLLSWLAVRRLPFRIAAVGTVTLATLSSVSNLLGHDLGVFEWIALPANLFWLGGLIGIAVTAARAGGTLPRALVVLLPFTWVAAIPLSSLGGGILTAAWFAAVAVALTRR